MKFVAMYLPQFHRDPNNDRWWGDGFTEWENVRNAQPLFSGHRQPRVPVQGHYDLARAEVLHQQAALARAHGVDAFAIYDYWYDGTRLLHRPLDVLLENRDIDIEFSLCWANHSWTRSWSNRSGAWDVLIQQTYPTQRDRLALHFQHLIRAFSDPRYLRIDGRPFYQIYVPEHMGSSLPNFTEGLREHTVRELGVEPHLSAFVTQWKHDWSHLRLFDSAALFQPSCALFWPVDMFGRADTVRGQTSWVRTLPESYQRRLLRVRDLLPDRRKEFDYPSVFGKLIEQYHASRTSAPLPLHPMAFVDFDNTPRYKRRARLFRNYSSANFAQHLVRLTAAASARAPLLFVNAWNEWGEGAYLEPDTEEGHARLEAVRLAKQHAPGTVATRAEGTAALNR
jgi:Glycosyltransferase WbsX